jgi:hypothetical protein
VISTGKEENDCCFTGTRREGRKTRKREGSCEMTSQPYVQRNTNRTVVYAGSQAILHLQEMAPRDKGLGADNRVQTTRKTSEGLEAKRLQWEHTVLAKMSTMYG